MKPNCYTSAGRAPKIATTSTMIAALAAGIFASIAVAAPPEIRVLSNRADLISGSDALVEIKWPAGAPVAFAKIAVNGVNVNSMFAQRANGRYMGLLTGLSVGDNVLTARVPGAYSQITINNHPIGGPVFSGAQLEPWICATMSAQTVPVTGNAGQIATATTRNPSLLNSDPVVNYPAGVSKCDTPPTYTYYYKKVTAPINCTFAVSGANACFTAYTPGSPATVPADAADFTNDKGDTVKYLIRVERGSINRGIYQLVTLYDPRDANVPWAPPKGWNGKLYWKFGPGGGFSRFETIPGVATIIDDKSLSRGFMVASASLTDGSNNINTTLAAETMMMIKEHIIESYGEIRYTMSEGSSGGSVEQNSIASGYPGLLNGITPGAQFPDMQPIFLEVNDCGLLQNVYYPKSSLSDVQKLAINGHAASTGSSILGFCNAWITSFLGFSNPAVNNCGSGFPAALIYNPSTNPSGIRCGVHEQISGLVGTFVDSDGVTKANSPRDNVGVQYGLKPLRAWAANQNDPSAINPELFVQLNEGVGGYDADFVWRPSRMQANPAALHNYYNGGSIVTDGRQLAKVPIIDMRPQQPPEGNLHMTWRSLQTRDRLDRDHGGHDNQVIWASDSGNFQPEAFLRMDTWLANIESDPTSNPIEVKVVANKPAGTADLCEVTPGGTRVGLFDPSCPVKYYGSPHQVAGAPRAENIFKCQLKALDFSSPDYAGISFTSDQKARLAAVFPGGVCDWTKPGVGQVAVTPWATYSAGPGGQPLGDPPTSVAIP